MRDSGGRLGNLVRRPGALTVHYRHGRRKPYIGPFALFLLTNVLFVAMELLPGSNIFSTPLDQHLHNQPWSALAQDLVTHHLEDKETTLDAYAPVFDQSVAKNAQSLVILMVLPFALLLPVLFRRSRMPFAVHLAFSLHFHAFLLLLISAALLIPAIDRWLGGAGLASPALDNGIAISSLLICALYLYVSAGRVYGGSGTTRVFKAVLLALAAGGIFLGYRFTLLLVTLVHDLTAPRRASNRQPAPRDFGVGPRNQCDCEVGHGSDEQTAENDRRKSSYDPLRRPERVELAIECKYRRHRPHGHQH